MLDHCQLTHDTLVEFCGDFLANPYRCYTEHGLHALFYAQLFAKIPEAVRFPDVRGKKMCVLQKEYPTDHNLDRSRRQHWDIAVIKTPIDLPTCKQAYDRLRLAAVIDLRDERRQRPPDRRH